MMLYKNMKAMVCSLDDDTDFFDIISGVLQGNTFAPFLFIICLDYVLWMSVNLMKETGLALVQEKWTYPIVHRHTEIVVVCPSSWQTFQILSTKRCAIVSE